MCPPKKIVDTIVVSGHNLSKVGWLNAYGASLHVLWDERDGFLSAERIAQVVPQWRDADIWFCGPAAFGQALRADVVAQGLPAERFHQELFEMR